MKHKSLGLNTLYCWLFFFALMPLALIVLTSFLSHDKAHFFTLPFTLNNYINLFSPLFAKIFIRSLIVAVLTTGLCLFFAYPCSYLMTRSRHQSVLLILIMIPFWTSSLVRTYAMISILKLNGILNAILLKSHLIKTPLPMLYSNFAVLVGLVYTLLPFMILPIYTNMERFDGRLLEAAKDLGANRWAQFFRVYLPNTMPGIVSGCLLVFMPAMTLFFIPNLLGGARALLIGNLIQTQFLELDNWPQGAATSILLTVLLIILLLFLKRGNKQAHWGSA